MTVLVGIVLLLLGISGAIALWVYWPSLDAARERQRIEHEVRRGQWQAQQVSYEAMQRLLREARQQPEGFVMRDGHGPSGPG